MKATVLVHPSKGLLGLFGTKEAKVELEWEERMDPPSVAVESAGSNIADVPASPGSSENVDAAVEQARAYIGEVIAKMGVTAIVERAADESGSIVFQAKGKDLGILIGRRGQTLDALQTLVNVRANRQSGEHIRIILDAERFRERRKKTLEDLSMRLANQVIRTKKEIELEPMSSHDRRIIHFRLQGHPKVKTFSRGEEPNRRIVITLKL